MPFDRPHPASRSLRRSGRSSRMLEAAAWSLARDRKPVVVVVPSHNDLGVWHPRWEAALHAAGYDDTFGPLPPFALVRYGKGEIDPCAWKWRPWQPVCPDHELFVDHHVLELVTSEIRWFQELHRFDPPESDSPQPVSNKSQHPTFGADERRLIL